MIDNQDQVDRLMVRLRDTVPFPARGTSRLMASLRGGAGTPARSTPCTVTRIDYAGDGGGIMCHLSFNDAPDFHVVVASITHLEFDGRLQMAREIAAYQKHRTKRLRREHAFGSALTEIHRSL